MSLALAASTAHADDKRPLPDYDGRGNVDSEVDENPIVWVPRIALSPFYVANEFLLRRPIGFLVRHAEQGRWIEKVTDIFTFGPDGENMIIPTALFDFGLSPSVGLYLEMNDLGVKHNTLKLHAATWGPDWIDITGAERYAITKHDVIQLRGEYKRSIDNLFMGIGPEATDKYESRYGLDRVDVGLTYARVLGNESHFDIQPGFHRVAFFTGACCGNPELDQTIAAGNLDAPPGYRQDYTTALLHAALVFDSRDPRPAPGSGGFLWLHSTMQKEISDPLAWIEYGGTVGGAVDLTGTQRILKLSLSVDMIDPLQGSGDKIPFTEYPTATSDFMPGFVNGWMTGRSFATAQLGYRWPVWAYLDGQARFSMGNAFGEHLDGLRPGNFRMSYDIGVTTSTARDTGFEILVGAGTETLDQGAHITSWRITFGSRRGF